MTIAEQYRAFRSVNIPAVEAIRYEWLATETQAAQDAHDAEVSAGHEWHQAP